jgi:hypothetical protein
MRTEQYNNGGRRAEAAGKKSGRMTTPEIRAGYGPLKNLHIVTQITDYQEKGRYSLFN